MAEKICRKCNQAKSVDQFSKHTGTKDKLDNRCKECVQKVKSDSKRERRPSEKDETETEINNQDWQGGKHNGSVFERVVKNKSSDATVLIVAVGGKQKTFNPKNFESQQKCSEAAFGYKKCQSDELQLTSNKYKIVHKEGVPSYIIVQLSQNYVTLCDYNQLEFVKRNSMCR